ncbi:MAG: hypothetical protein IJJ29_03020 [Solobacterium sp.]|jgi:dTDP-4-dehydrorhamnose 3,5-epimerase-like enzyme|nr:hypothetical protein [Solobacterium sp.]
MSEFNKYVEEIRKLINDQVDKTARTITDNTREFTEVFQKERRKIELRSQIGQHQRQVSKAYERIGQAYFENIEEGKSMDHIKDVIDLLRSNRKVIELLKQQLAELEPETEDKKAQ